MKHLIEDIENDLCHLKRDLEDIQDKISKLKIWTNAPNIEEDKNV